VGALGAVELFGFGLGYILAWLLVQVEESVGIAYVGLALLDGRVAVGIRHIGFFAAAGHDEAVDEA